jgi:hypothetical protein
MLVGLDSTIIPTQVKKENKETTTTNLLRETKQNIPIAQTTYKVATYLRGEGGVPHGNYVAQLDLEKSTTYPCMFCHSNLPS